MVFSVYIVVQPPCVLDPPIARTDSGGTTMRVVIGTAMIEAISHVWKILAAGGVFSDRTSAYWDDRLFFPLAEGSYLLASAIVISVWMDVANSSMSRAKVTYPLTYPPTHLVRYSIQIASFLVLSTALNAF